MPQEIQMVLWPFHAFLCPLSSPLPTPKVYIHVFSVSRLGQALQFSHKIPGNICYISAHSEGSRAGLIQLFSNNCLFFTWHFLHLLAVCYRAQFT